MANIPTDPRFGDQWHLQNETPGLLDLNVVDVWDDYTGAGVEVAVIDNAVDHRHQDLRGNYSTVKDWDFEDNDADPTGVDGNNHGTPVAGIIGASEGNGFGGVGVAYDSTIFGFRVNGSINNQFVRQLTNAIDNASGLEQQSGVNREADVVNISLGSQFRNNFGSNYFDTFFPAADMGALNRAIDNAAVFGRDGLGTILVKSAGNERSTNHDTNSSSWNANPHTISVAAVDQNGFVSDYSNHGASVLVSAFGTNNEVLTTDRTGSEGYNTGPAGNHTTFDGTSAAAPMVSGVVALMLEANPDLGWRDVQEILAYSARHVGSDVGAGIRDDEEYAWTFNGANNWNGGGLHFSNDYGFGLVDAKAAVRLAETWGDTAKTSANDVTVSRDFLNASRTISTGGTSFIQNVNNNIDIEHVEVDINFTRWDDLGDLELRLISPDGTSSTLIDNSGEDNEAASGGFGAGRWKFYSNAFRGEDTAGNWRVELIDQDSAATSPITINDVIVRFKGQAASANDTFIFTEEYSDYDGLFGHSRAINGGSGVDTINAAAVDSNTRINLGTGRGTIDGVAVTTSSIENVITGDGNDAITGSRGNNKILGMRGNDTISANSGNDTVDGGAGRDTLFGGTGNDTLTGGLGNDILNGTNYAAQGTGERDILFSGSQQDEDVFVLGDRKNGVGRVFYSDQGTTDHAVIKDFDAVGNITDTIQLMGSASSYSIRNVNRGGAFAGAGISFSGDLIGVVEGINASSLNLSNSNQFTYV
ncbi:MAG: S8 family serine peptidase [Cyanobacteria bacterium J06639_14]